MNILSLFLPRPTAPRRPSRAFRPGGLGEQNGFGLEARRPPSTILVDVTDDDDLFSEYVPWYGSNPTNPSDPNQYLYFYGETDSTSEVVTSGTDTIFPGSGPVTYAIHDEQVFNGEVIIPDDGVLFTKTATSRIDHDLEMTFVDVATGLPPATPVGVSGMFSMSLALGGGIRAVEDGIYLSFTSDFASVNVQGFYYNASWSYLGTSYSASGDVRDGLTFTYAGLVSDGSFNMDSVSILDPEMYVYTDGPDEAHATFNMTFSMNASL